MPLHADKGGGIVLVDLDHLRLAQKDIVDKPWYTEFDYTLHYNSLQDVFSEAFILYK